MNVERIFLKVYIIMDGPKMKNIDKINIVEPSSITKIYLMIGVVVFTLLISMFAFKNGGPTWQLY